MNITRERYKRICAPLPQAKILGGRTYPRSEVQTEIILTNSNIFLNITVALFVPALTCSACMRNITGA